MILISTWKEINKVWRSVYLIYFLFRSFTRWGIGINCSGSGFFRLELNQYMARERCNIKGYPYRLARWDAEFNPKKDSSYKPVWIELPKLPLILFQPKLLKVVAESIGKFLDMDNFTRNLLRPSVAKICVLMDISKTLPENIWISAPSMKGFWQQIRYPDPPLYCNHCGLQSHSIQTCWHKNP